MTYICTLNDVTTTTTSIRTYVGNPLLKLVVYVNIQHCFIHTYVRSNTSGTVACSPMLFFFHYLHSHNFANQKIKTVMSSLSKKKKRSSSGNDGNLPSRSHIISKRQKVLATGGGQTLSPVDGQTNYSNGVYCNY